MVLTSVVAALAAVGAVRHATVDTRATSTEASNDVAVAPPAEAGNKPEQRWNRREVRVVLDPSLDELGLDFRTVARRAFDAWNDTGAALPSIVFERGEAGVASLEPDGRSSILLSNIEFEGHDTDLAITIGFSDPSTGEISEADIVINAAHVFSRISNEQVTRSAQQAASTDSPEQPTSCTGSLDARACDGTYDLQNVLTHEVGHFFGLGENYDDPRATMFSCTSSCEIHKRDLAPGDDDDISRLYADQAAPLPQGCSGVQMGGHPRLLNPSGWSGLLLLLLALAWRRRHPSSRS